MVLLQISASASSPYLSDVATFPLFLRTVSSEGEVAVGIKAAMKEFGWSRIATITQSENLFTFVSFCSVSNYKYVCFMSTEYI